MQQKGVGVRRHEEQERRSGWRAVRWFRSMFFSMIAIGQTPSLRQSSWRWGFWNAWSRSEGVRFSAPPRRASTSSSVRLRPTWRFASSSKWLWSYVWPAHWRERHERGEHALCGAGGECTVCCAPCPTLA